MSDTAITSETMCEPPASSTHAGGESYRKIFKSSAMLGGARGINMAVGMARVKAMALLLGTVGVGIFSMYEQIVYTVTAISSLGINSSGVREVALAVGTGDHARVARAAKHVRRVLIVMGLLGSAVMALFAEPISRIYFNDSSHALGVCGLAVAIVLTVVGQGLANIVQGLGRMADLARQNVMAGVIGTLVGLIFLVVFREKGIVPALLAVAGGTFFSGWWYERKAALPSVDLPWKDTVREARPLITLGLAMMNAAVISSMVGSAAQALIQRKLGVAAVGIYGCAYNLSGKFVSLVIIPMWGDFFPRASAVSHDPEALGKAVNEQTEVALFLATPGLLATIAFAPWIIHLLYSHDFADSAPLLRWFCLGCLASVMGGPMKMVQVAMGRSLLCFITETSCSLIYVGLIVVSLKFFGLPGAAMAYFAANCIQMVVSFIVAHRLVRLTWSAHTTRHVTVLGVVALALVGTTFILAEWQAITVGAIVTAIVSCYCLRQMIRRLGSDHRVTIYAVRLPVIGRWLAAP